jgi:hypothetical protein
MKCAAARSLTLLPMLYYLENPDRERTGESKIGACSRLFAEHDVKQRPECDKGRSIFYRSDFGFQSRASFCASATCARVTALSKLALLNSAAFQPCVADKLYHMSAWT